MDRITNARELEEHLHYYNDSIVKTPCLLSDLIKGNMNCKECEYNFKNKVLGCIGIGMGLR